MAIWEIKGRELVNCSCEYGCNCQFKALPDKGHCHAVAGILIEEGHHGDTPLDGLKLAAIFKWPGAIHEGNGEAIAFVDVRADAAQRDALLRILSGQDTDPFATMFAVYASTLTTLPGWRKSRRLIQTSSSASDAVSASTGSKLRTTTMLQWWLTKSPPADRAHPVAHRQLHHGAPRRPRNTPRRGPRRA